ncbi:hypothetical protein IWW52_000696 [Coemansia sp. RSA 2704]|nr:hypothetical protein IWW52_000696 [Coemansia sp. RSA 2704]
MHELSKKYGNMLGKKMLGRGLKERKYFDSGDYALKKAGVYDGSNIDRVGDEHPSPATVPHHSAAAASQAANAPVDLGGEAQPPVENIPNLLQRKKSTGKASAVPGAAPLASTGSGQIPLLQRKLSAGKPGMMPAGAQIHQPKTAVPRHSLSEQTDFLDSASNVGSDTENKD